MREVVQDNIGRPAITHNVVDTEDKDMLVRLKLDQIGAEERAMIQVEWCARIDGQQFPKRRWRIRLGGLLQILNVDHKLWREHELSFPTRHLRAQCIMPRDYVCEGAFEGRDVKVATGR